MLNQGLVTSLAYKQRVADSLDVPKGKELRMLRRVARYDLRRLEPRAAPTLSTGSIERMAAMQDKPDPGTFTPILQVTNVKAIPSTRDNSRFRFILSGGSHFVPALTWSQTVSTGDTVQQDMHHSRQRLQANVVSGRKMIILLGLTVLEQYANGRIGNPVNVNVYPRQRRIGNPINAHPGRRAERISWMICDGVYLTDER